MARERRAKDLKSGPWKGSYGQRKQTAHVRGCLMTCLDYCIPNRASVAQEATVCTGVGSSRVGRCWTGDIRDNRGDIATRLHTVRVADLLPLLLPSLHLFFLETFLTVLTVRSYFH